MKLAILFPGMGYSADKPLLYYSGKVLSQNGYEVLVADYQGVMCQEDIHVLKDELKESKAECKKYLEYVSKAVEVTIAAFGEIPFDKYESIIFVSKSIGTVVATFFEMKLNLSVKHIYLTPLEQIFQIRQHYDGIVFIGTNDPFSHYSVIEKQCESFKLQLHLIDDGNHSLETGNWDIDLRNLDEIITVIDQYVRDIS